MVELWLGLVVAWAQGVMVLTLAYCLTEVTSALDFGNPRNVMLASVIVKCLTLEYLNISRCYTHYRLLPEISFIAETKNVIFDCLVKFFLLKLSIEINEFKHLSCLGILIAQEVQD
jgi:hypothetical protein